ncbi:MAG: hypothetical protein A2V88_09625 [Elusimicrobia bacterium RBG_16_66_12]|nr:MAG: hypothetical protein A2V88_09625 [Elusimicrobia bacterium RBG_16_66_12]
MASEEKPTEKRSLRVLVIDDQESVRSFLSRFVSRLGFEVSSVESGSRAVELVKSEGFDLYFIDMRMPGLNGLETLRGIRRIVPSAAVVVMTGYADEELLAGVRAEGVIDILAKPFDLGRLRAIVAGLPRA